MYSSELNVCSSHGHLLKDFFSHCVCIGRSYSVFSQRMLNQCLESLVQKIQSGVVINFEKTGPDPSPTEGETAHYNFVVVTWIFTKYLFDEKVKRRIMACSVFKWYGLTCMAFCTIKLHLSMWAVFYYYYFFACVISELDGLVGRCLEYVIYIIQCVNVVIV